MTSWFREDCPEGGTGLLLAVERKLAEVRSEYQLIEVHQTTHFGRLLTLDGLVMLTQRDHFIYHEMLAHPALLSHPEPRRVAVVGGGDCGLLTEVLRHDSVRSAVQIEIDPEVTRVALEHFPEFRAAARDARAELLTGDGAAWVRENAAAGADVLLVDSTDPVGPAAQLFERPFLEQCRRALGQTGILAMQSESPLFHIRLIRKLRGTLRAAGFADVVTLTFPQCTYPSGWWSVTLAAQGDLTRFRSAAELQTRYYTPAIHRGALAVPPFLELD